MPTIGDLSDRYANFMITPGPAGPDFCDTCWTPCNPAFGRCYRCSNQPNHLAAMVPLTYSLDLGQMHTALRGYKDGWAGDCSDAFRNGLTSQLAAVLTRFVDAHERCLAQAAAVDAFDVVTWVPSSRPNRWRLKWILEVGCTPLKDRAVELLEATVGGAGKEYDARRYRATENLSDMDVLLVDDTWTKGASAQSAAAALLASGAPSVSLLVIGRHVTPNWQPIAGGKTNEDILRGHAPFDWDVCGFDL